MLGDFQAVKRAIMLDSDLLAVSKQVPRFNHPIDVRKLELRRGFTVVGWVSFQGQHPFVGLAGCKLAWRELLYEKLCELT